MSRVLKAKPRSDSLALLLLGKTQYNIIRVVCRRVTRDLNGESKAFAYEEEEEVVVKNGSPFKSYGFAKIVQFEGGGGR